MRKILILGNFSYRTNTLDGQSVKTRDIYQLTKEQLNAKIDYYDTEDFQFDKISLFKLLKKVICCNCLIYVPAHRNLKFIFPIIYCLSILFNIKIHYFVVGGWLREFISKLPVHRFMLAHIKAIHSETSRLKIELEKYYGFKNVDIFPNFRFFSFLPSRTESKKLRLVFMARVNKMKGLDWIFHLADYIQNKNLSESYSISFYGPINEDDREYFYDNLRQYSFMQYYGVLQPEDIYLTLSQYDLMLLPTHYYTEGLPGSIVDAYISGIPVIVTKWKHANEFVEDWKSGFIIPFNCGEDVLIDRVLKLGSDRTLLFEMQKYVLHKRYEFSPPLLESYLGKCR